MNSRRRMSDMGSSSRSGARRHQPATAAPSVYRTPACDRMLADIGQTELFWVGGVGLEDPFNARPFWNFPRKGLRLRIFPAGVLTNGDGSTGPFCGLDASSRPPGQRSAGRRRLQDAPARHVGNVSV
jgi:hypothetical protein